MEFISIDSGDYKPSYTWGVPPCSYFALVLFPSLHRDSFLEPQAPLNSQRLLLEKPGSWLENPRTLQGDR